MGYPYHRFIDQTVLDTFKCVMCNNVLKNTKVLSCEDFCCESCLEFYENEERFPCPKCGKVVDKISTKDPPRVFYSFYSSLRIRCEYDACEMVCGITEIAEHEKDCTHNPINIFYCENCKYKYSINMYDYSMII